MTDEAGRPAMWIHTEGMLDNYAIRHLDATGFGAYMALLMRECVRGPLPHDDKRLQSLSGAKPWEWEEIRTEVMALFLWSEDGWESSRSLVTKH